MEKKFENVSSKYGAPMGRHTGPTISYGGKITLQRVRLNSGGYDNGGAYWGFCPITSTGTATKTAKRVFCARLRATMRRNKFGNWSKTRASIANQKCLNLWSYHRETQSLKAPRENRAGRHGSARPPHGGLSRLRSLGRRFKPRRCVGTIKALRLFLLEELAQARDEIKRSPMYQDDMRETMREQRAAVRACQLEVNRHNAFLKRQFTLPLTMAAHA